MTIDRRILVGREVYVRDDQKIGEVKGVTADAEFVIVARPLSSDLLVPMDEFHEIGGRLKIRRTGSFLDDAPEVDADRLSLDDRQRLEVFYRRAARGPRETTEGRGVRRRRAGRRTPPLAVSVCLPCSGGAAGAARTRPHGAAQAEEAGAHAACLRRAAVTQPLSPRVVVAAPAAPMVDADDAFHDSPFGVSRFRRTA